MTKSSATAEATAPAKKVTVKTLVASYKASTKEHDINACIKFVQATRPDAKDGSIKTAFYTKNTSKKNARKALTAHTGNAVEVLKAGRAFLSACGNLHEAKNVLDALAN